MKPTPEDMSEIEPPMTRALFATDRDDQADNQPADNDRTLEAEEDTRHLPHAAHPSPLMTDAAGPDGGMFSAWSSGAPTSGGGSGRGIVGKIEPEQTLYSKYRVIRQLGAGAMGEVWLVRHATLKSQHALKVIIPNFAKNALALMRFQREFEVMASLRHEHAVQIYDAKIDDEGGYIDMEYVEGQTIHEILADAKKRPDLDPTAPLMPLDWIVRILDQLCEVLQVAHEKGIVHRDLKPSNMMCLGNRKAGKEYLKVLDFGIAKVRDDPDGASGRNEEESENKTQGFIGTPSYGSPEQAMVRDDVDGRADLYSVGIMLYEFITGKLPFRGNHWQVMSQNATAPPPPFNETNPSLRPLPEVELAVLRVLKKSPENRPQTARELFDDFREAVERVSPGDALARTDSGPFRAIPSSTIPPTDLDGAMAHGLASTQVATLLGEAGPRSLGKPSPEPRSDFGGPILHEAPPHSPPWIKIGWAAVGLLLVTALVAGMVIKSKLDGETAGVPSKDIPNKDTLTKTPKRGDSFESYWGPDFVAVAGSGEGEIWPAQVRRTSDQVYFNKFADGIYLPDEYKAVDPKDLVDGWPRVIVRNDVRFLRIPGNKEFVMGAWDAPYEKDRPDVPAHPVILSGYYLQETEVTNGQFEGFLAMNKEMPRPVDWEQSFSKLKGRMTTDVARRHPAVNLSRIMALSFAEEMKAQLPTEAQWEYAARSAGESRLYVWGKTPDPGQSQANIDNDKAITAPVGSYPLDKTDQGVLDLCGNVKELCRDSYEAYADSKNPVANPCQVPLNPVDVKFVVRGASYDSTPSSCRITRRSDEDAKKAEEFAENVGFRLVVECPDTRKRRY